MRKRYIVTILILLAIISGCIERQTTEIRYIYVTPEISKPVPTPIIFGDDREKIQFPKDLDRALSDYKWRLDLVAEQTTRLDILYTGKAGVTMNQMEYKNWMEYIQASTEEFTKRNLNAINSGRNYAQTIVNNIESLDRNGAAIELERIEQNEGIMKSDMKKVIDSYNENVKIYNDKWAN